MEQAGHAMGMAKVGCAHDISVVSGPTDEFGGFLADLWGWPKDLAESWAEQSLTLHTPFFLRCRYADLPFAWNADSLVGEGASRRQRQIAQILKDAGYQEAVVVPVHLPRGRVAVISWWGERSATEVEQLVHDLGPQLIAISHYFVNLLGIQALPTDSGHMSPPSVRELECLTLASNGLSDVEIAHEMQISIHTVRYHINSVARRLRARNRTHAVALATQLGIIGLANPLERIPVRS